MKVARMLIAVSLLTASALGADPEPYLRSAPMPFYPPLARQARVEGTVSLHFTVNERGDTSEIEVTAGHEMLKGAAIANVEGWKFRWPQYCICRRRREAVFVYKISDKEESPERPSVTVRWFGKTSVVRIEIEGDLVPVETQNAY